MNYREAIVVDDVMAESGVPEKCKDCFYFPDYHECPCSRTVANVDITLREIERRGGGTAVVPGITRNFKSILSDILIQMVTQQYEEDKYEQLLHCLDDAVKKATGILFEAPPEDAEKLMAEQKRVEQEHRSYKLPPLPYFAEDNGKVM